MKTIVYIDGFNLYYSRLRNTPYRWLNLSSFCARELPDCQIEHIHYFTAVVQKIDYDPQQPKRQKAFLRALQTLPDITIHYGTFIRSKKYLTPVEPSAASRGKVRVYEPREKASDVNLSTQLFVDAIHKRMELAVVLSNDSDLRMPIRAVRKEMSIPVRVLFPVVTPREASVDLKKATVNHFQIVQDASLAACQFPPLLHDADGDIRKPDAW